MDRSSIFIAPALVLSLALVASACDCVVSPSPTKSLEHAHAVFSGKVVKIEAFGKYERSVTLAVNTAWKGVKAKEVTLRTPNNGASCGYEFKEGKSYLIYAYEGKDESEKKPYLHTNICTRTAVLEDATEDLKELGDGKKLP